MKGCGSLGDNSLPGGDAELQRRGRQQVAHRGRTFLPHLAQLPAAVEVGRAIAATAVVASRGGRRIVYACMHGGLHVRMVVRAGVGASPRLRIDWQLCLHPRAVFAAHHRDRAQWQCYAQQGQGHGYQSSHNLSLARDGRTVIGINPLRLCYYRPDV